MNYLSRGLTQRNAVTDDGDSWLLMLFTFSSSFTVIHGFIGTLHSFLTRLREEENREGKKNPLIDFLKKRIVGEF